MVIKREIMIPEEGKPRKLYIYLPEEYESRTTRYPVLYMFDGQNVFFDEDATFGKSMGMYAYMKKSRKKLIIVAVESSTEGNKRLEEYSPVDFVYGPVGEIMGRGDKHMNWLVNEIKPFIDREFRTKPDRENTSVCGTSMGGLMALYAACAYNHVFMKAACLSPSLWIAPDRICEILKGASVSKDTVIYMDYGSKEMKNHPESLKALQRTMGLLMDMEVNAALRIIPGGTHSESSWERQIPVFMRCLGL